MKEEKTLEAIVKRCQGECYIGIVGAVRPTGNNLKTLLSKIIMKYRKICAKNCLNAVFMIFLNSIY